MAGVRRLGERPDVVFDSLLRSVPSSALRRPPHQGSTTTGIAACWAWRCGPNFPTNPYVYVFGTPTTPRSTAPRPVLQLRLRLRRPLKPPTAARSADAAVPARSQAGHVSTAPEQVLINGNRRATPHRIRPRGHGGVRPRRRAGREQQRRRGLNVAPLRPDSVESRQAHPRQPGAGTRPARRRRAPEPGPPNHAGRGGGGCGTSNRQHGRPPTAGLRFGGLVSTSGTTAADEKGVLPGNSHRQLHARAVPGARPATRTPRSARAWAPATQRSQTVPASTLCDGPFHQQVLGEAKLDELLMISSTRVPGSYGAFFWPGDQRLHFEKVHTQATAQETGTTDQAWHHWSIVQGAGNTDVILYKDGVNVTTSHTSMFVDTGADVDKIGRHPASTPVFFGSLEPVCRRQQGGLSAAQVAAHYAARTVAAARRRRATRSPSTAPCCGWTRTRRSRGDLRRLRRPARRRRSSRTTGNRFVSPSDPARTSCGWVTLAGARGGAANLPPTPRQVS